MMQESVLSPKNVNARIPPQKPGPSKKGPAPKAAFLNDQDAGDDAAVQVGGHTMSGCPKKGGVCGFMY